MREGSWGVADEGEQLRRATAAGVKVLELKLHPPSWLPRESIREEVERGLERWKKSRTSEQQVASVRSRPTLLRGKVTDER